MADPNFANVEYLLHFDGSNGGTIVDSSLNAHTPVPDSGAALSTARSKFGTASLLISSNTGYVSLPKTTGYGNGPWCTETWIYLEACTNGARWLRDGTVWPYWRVNSARKLSFYYYDFGASTYYTRVGTTVLDLASWYHLAVTYDGTYVRGFVNGNLEFEHAASISIPGAPTSHGIYGWEGSSGDTYSLDEMRITIGEALYTAAFTAPTAAFPENPEWTGTGALTAQSAAMSGTVTTLFKYAAGTFAAQSATVSGVANVTISGSGALTAQNVVVAGAALWGNGYEATETVVVTEPALDTIYGISAAILCNAQLTTSATLTEVLTWGTEENASLSDAVATLLSLPLPVTEAANMAEVLTAVATVLVTETVTLTETFPEGTQITWDAVESFLASSSLDVRQTFVDALTASLAAQSLALFATLDSVTETTTLGEVLAEAAAYVHAVVEALAISETGSAVLNLIFAVDEETTLSEALAAGLHFSDSLVAGLAFVGTLSTDADSTATWVVHPEIPAATTYNNFDFNSFAGVGDTFLGAMTDGIYELTGEDDAGTDIASVVRTGLLELGSSLLKQVTRAYLGYTSDGRLILKTVTTDGGDKTERWYELEETANAVREARIKLGKGVKARYWQFELINADGADFHVDQLQLLPMALSRRVKE